MKPDIIYEHDNDTCLAFDFYPEVLSGTCVKGVGNYGSTTCPGLRAYLNVKKPPGPADRA